MLACRHPSHEEDHSMELAGFPSTLTLRRGIFCPLKHDTIADQHPQSVTSIQLKQHLPEYLLLNPRGKQKTPFLGSLQKHVLALPFFFDAPLVPFPHTQHGHLSSDGIMWGANRSGACGF